MNLTGKTIVVVGAQKSGLAIAKLAKEAGAVNVKISEKSKPEQFDVDVHNFIAQHNIEMEWGGHTKLFIQSADILVLSPGVRYDAEVVKWANERKIAVLGEIEFAFQFCQIPVIAVTGSNGKTTTVNLIKNMLIRAGYKACLCGNVGTPFSECAYTINSNDYVVLEVSSFQMESLLSPESIFRSSKSPLGFVLRGFKPYIAVVLNFNPNHLDRHKDIDEYFESKTQVFLNQTTQDYAVLNSQSDRSRVLARHLKSQVVFYDEGKEFGEGFNDNQLAVLKIAQLLKIRPQICYEVFGEFKGIEHRLEWVRQINGVDYINDSKSTTLEAGEWALKNMTKPVVMICGGSDKNLDYTPLRDLVRMKVKHMVVLGNIRMKLKDTFSDVVPLSIAEDFRQAIDLARAQAQFGDQILLSPMTASFDMFKNFEHRGQVFKEIVHSLK